MTEKTLYPTNMKVRDVFKLTRGFYPQFDLEYAGIAWRTALGWRRARKLARFPPATSRSSSWC
jgi:hypothetical protein